MFGIEKKSWTKVLDASIFQWNPLNVVTLGHAETDKPNENSNGLLLQSFSIIFNNCVYEI
jgi:hypothetical protein